MKKLLFYLLLMGLFNACSPKGITIDPGERLQITKIIYKYKKENLSYVILSSPQNMTSFKYYVAGIDHKVGDVIMISSIKTIKVN